MNVIEILWILTNVIEIFWVVIEIFWIVIEIFWILIWKKNLNITAKEAS